MENTNLTCITCLVKFNDAALQRLHYKSDWHRYNLTRKVASLPPISIEDFQKRVTQQQRIILEKSVIPESVYCEHCRKAFGNQNSFNNHLGSKKHKINTKSVNLSASHDKVKSCLSDNDQELDSQIEIDDSDKWSDYSEIIDYEKICLFCAKEDKNILNNIEHMTSDHSFFIPDIEYCTDLSGLLNYLGEKIEKDFICIWCNDKGRTFYSAEAVRNHMLDKGHCRMLHEGAALAEYVEFYDYSSSYPDAEDENIDIDEELSMPEVDQSDYQLVLPSGASIGHRSLMRYYKQNLYKSSTSCVPLSKSSKRLHCVLATYRMLGWTATQQECAARKAKDIHYMKRMQSKLQLKFGLQANRLQKHFRHQVNF